MESVNHSMIRRLFDKSMLLSTVLGIQYDNVLLFTIDAAPYMVKAGRSIKSFYPKNGVCYLFSPCFAPNSRGCKAKFSTSRCSHIQYKKDFY